MKEEGRDYSVCQHKRPFATAASQRILNQCDRRLRVVHFHDQLVVPLIVQINDDGFLRVMHVPEDPDQ